MKTHYMQLTNLPFNKIKSGTKTIESRLYDDKRRLIQIGDIIIFKNNDNNEEVKTKVISLNIYPDFEKLFKAFDVQKFGAENIDFLINEINQFYTINQQKQYGVVGIGIEKHL